MRRIISLFTVLVIIVSASPVVGAAKPSSFSSSFDFSESFTTSTGVIGNVDPANYYPDSVLQYSPATSRLTTGLWTTETTDAEDDGADDVLIGRYDGSYLYIGFEEKFDGIALDISTDATGGTYELEYWNGTWDELYEGGSEDLSNESEENAFNKIWDSRPSGWEKVSVNGSDTMYYVRLHITEDYSAVAKAGQVGIVDYNLQITASNELGDTLYHGTDFLIGLFDGSGTVTADINVYDYYDDGNITYMAINAPAEENENEYEIDIYASGYSVYILDDLDLGKAVTYFDAADMYFAHVLEAVDAGGDSVDIDSAFAGDSDVDCELYGGQAYCAVEYNDDDDSTATVLAVGYVTTTAAIPDVVDPSYDRERTEFTLDVAYLLTLKNEDASSGINGAAVTATSGSSTVTCSDWGNGEYACVVPASSSVVDIEVSADGYEDLSDTFSTVRTGASDAQVTETFYLSKNSSGSDSEPTPVDTDGDGLNDDDEGIYGTDINDSDSDNDGLTDGEEVYTYGTEPNDEDTDDDGAFDGYEIASNTDPLDSSDYTADAADQQEECSDSFSDTSGHWAEKAICMLYERGVVQGRTPTAFAPDMDITRAEFLKIAILNADESVIAGTDDYYPDVESSDWFFPYVSYATEQGYVEGYDDGSFRPNDMINRAEAVVMIMRIAGYEDYSFSDSDLDFSDVSSDDWYAYAVVLSDDNHIVSGYSDGTFKAGNLITRAEVAVIARRVWYTFYQ